jgi:hypothetical protein
MTFNDNLGRIWKEADENLFKILSQKLPDGNGENFEMPHSVRIVGLKVAI